ncbi:MAG TPA: hypothetical protein VN765_04445 [Candidatus Acidoferrum sp.]|nr:hypothetical protein [Candidatus Acidoferrum sp.]
MKPLFPKSKLVLVNLAILFVILGGFVLVESGPEPWVDREMAFMGRLHNSLIDLDRAKYQWVTDKNKPETAVPTFDDLAPYLGEAKNRIEQLKALGVEYKITSTETNQSDVATLTGGIRFRTGFCTYYRAGTTFCFQTGWKIPPPSTSPATLRIRLIWLHAEFFLGVALFVLVVANVIIFLVRNLTDSSKPEEPQTAAAAAISTNPPAPASIRARDLYVLIFGCLFCLLGLTLLSMMSLPGTYLIEDMGNGVGAFLTGASLALPFFCRRFLKAKPAARLAFLVSLVPAACILWAFLSASFVPLPCHVAESGTKRIIKGMTKTQVLDAIGSPRGSSGGGGSGKMRLTYDYQIPWGWSGRQFFVDLIDDKVVSARIVRYGGEPNDDFWESDFIKDLKAGKALHSNLEVQPETNRTSTAAASGR